MSVQPEDWLLRYCLALDVGDFDRLGTVLEQAQTLPGLEEAIAGMHQRFDSHESWTRQLLTYRKSLQEKNQQDGH